MKSQITLDDVRDIYDLDIQMKDIYARADALTKEIKGNVINVRAIIEYTNYCNRNCAYCGLNCGNVRLKRYRMEPEEIVETAILAADAGYKTVVLQGGEDPHFTKNIFCEIIKEIKSNRDIAITLSAGEMTQEDYSAIKNAGCDRYLLKHETSDSDIYRQMHPGYSLSDRQQCLRTLKKLGFETGGGFMIGLPGQSVQTIINDLEFIMSIPCDMAGIGPFIPHPHTSLSHFGKGSADVTRRTIAAARLLMPHINLPATTSLGVLDINERNKVFTGGANVIMKKVTPPAYRKLYEIYPVNHGKIKSIAGEREEINDLLKSIGKDYD